MDMKRFIETWYFTETVEGISDIEDFLHCDSEIHDKQTSFCEWLKEQEEEENFKKWLSEHGILDDYQRACQ